MSEPNGSRFRVIFSQHLLNNLKNLHGQATEKGQGAKFLAALKRIVSSLREHPDQFGERRFTLRHLNLEVRVAFQPPLALTFGVHKQKPIVFVRQFWLLLGED